MDKKELAFTTRLTREDVAGVVEALVEGLKEGRLNIQKSGDNLEMDVPRVIDLEVTASLEEDKAEFIVEVSWRPNRAENPDRPDESDPAEAAGTTGKAAGSSPRKEAKASMREAAEAARSAAKSAGKAVKKTARAARVLVKESREKLKTEAREIKENNHGGNLFKQVAGAVEDAARRAKLAMQEIVSDAKRDREERKADAAKDVSQANTAEKNMNADAPREDSGKTGAAAPAPETKANDESAPVAEVKKTPIAEAQAAPEKAAEKPQSAPGGTAKNAGEAKKGNPAAKTPAKRAAGKSTAAKAAPKAKSDTAAKTAKKSPAVKSTAASGTKGETKNSAKKPAVAKKSSAKTGAKAGTPGTAKPE